MVLPAEATAPSDPNVTAPVFNTPKTILPRQNPQFGGMKPAELEFSAAPRQYDQTTQPGNHPATQIAEARPAGPQNHVMVYLGCLN